MTERSTTGFVRTLLSFRDDGVDGALKVKAEGVTTVIHLRRGTVVSAEGGTVADTLGRLLVENGVLAQEQYARAIDRMTESLVDDEQKRLGEVLVELGLMSVNDVQAALAEQVHRKLMGCLRWDRMELSLRRSSGTQLAHFPTPIEPAVLEGVTRFVSAERQMRIWAAFIAEQRGYVALATRAADVSERFGLDRPRMRTLRLLDGTRTAAELLAELDDDPSSLALATTLVLTSDLALRRPPATDEPRPRPKTTTPRRQRATRPRTGAGQRIAVPDDQRRQRRTQRPDMRNRPAEVRTRRMTEGERQARRNRRTGEAQPPGATSNDQTWRKGGGRSEQSIFRRKQPPSKRSVRGIPADELVRRNRITNSALDYEEARRRQSRSTGRGQVDKRARLEAERDYHFGTKHLYATRFGQALPQLERAARACPQILEYQLAYAFCRFRLDEQRDGLLDRRGELLELAKRVQAENPNLALPPYVIGHALMLVGDHGEALRSFRVAARHDPDNRDAERCIRLLEKRLRR